jgi:murein DD-endopeptidase MepM/ murein hydrolase activator NlpD
MDNTRGKTLQPSALLYAGAGAFIGIFATLLVPPAGFSGFAKPSLPSISLTSLVPDLLLTTVEPEAEAWAENMGATLRATGLVQTRIVQQGNTLGDVLMKSGIDRSAVASIVDATSQVYNLKKLRVGQEIELSFDALGVESDTTPLTALSFEIDPSHSISVMRQDDGTFAAKEVVANTRREHVRGEGVINSTLFETAQDAGIPIDVLGEMVKLFSYDVDFQRDIQKGDKFQVMYEHTVTDDGRPVRNLNIRYASMTLSGQQLKYYAHKQSDGSYDYYNDKGEGVRKALLRTPVNGAILTSGFGMRRHPILGYSVLHRGVDFGVPPGTPIMAAGDGVIEKREFQNGYGNYIRIRHSGEYSTAYAHMSRFGKGMAVGKRVRQGDIIGYVGSTGRVTGPHLHFEVFKKNTQVNPIAVKFPASEKLEGARMAAFRASQTETNQMFNALGTAQNIAAAEENAEPK